MLSPASPLNWVSGEKLQQTPAGKTPCRVHTAAVIWGDAVLQLGLKLLYKYLVYFTPTSTPPGVLANAGQKAAERGPLGVTSGLRKPVLSPGKFTF